MKKITGIIALSIISSFELSAQTLSSTPIVVQLQSPEKDYLDYSLLIIQVLTLIGLFVYVYKTWEIASANKKSADVSQNSINLSQKSIELSQAVLEEMKLARIQEIAPQIIVYFDMPYGDSWSIFLVIKNTGKTVAKDIQIAFDPPLKSGWGNKINNFDIPLIKNGISSFAPGQEIRTPFDSITNYFDSEMAKRLDGQLPTKYEISISYLSLFNEKKIHTKHIVDFSMFKDLSFLQEKTVKDLINAVEVLASVGKNMERDLRTITTKLIE